MTSLADGVRLHRGFGRRSVAAYNSHLSNAIHFACVPVAAGWIVEPLGWALLMARGGDPEHESEGDSHGEAQMRQHQEEGWSRVGEGDALWPELWAALQDWLITRKISLSARKEVRAVFWLAPATAPNHSAVLAAMARLAAGERREGFGEAKVWFVRHPETGHLFPAKMVWGLVTGRPGRDFISHQARDGLRRLGFDLPGPDQPAAEIAESPESLAALPLGLEGAERQVTRNIRERDPTARRAAEVHWRQQHDGRLVCEGCDLDFSRRYGMRGEGFMHFHHVEPLALAEGPRAAPGPEALVPLCPNCHAMVHRGEDLLSVEDLRRLIAAHESG